MAKAKTVDEYISGAPDNVREKLKELRAIIKSTAPQVEEKISYGIPYYGYKGRLVYFRYASTHIGFYIMPPVVQDHKEELKGYKTATSTVQLPLDKPLPKILLQTLIKAGVKNNETKEKK
jgi:uncharacterized protein YdhG (YjbR/CyaY superfamily)